ncbi:MAG: hypothetical protein IJW10_02210 [Clostridia bacterium]|nr:hypothetical protein [Clostridia bacterium]
MLKLKNHRTLLISLIIGFALVELVLGILVQTTVGVAETVVSFSAVALACLFGCLMCEKSKDYLFTQIGLCFTVFADLCLVVADPIQREWGMVFFSITQIAYFVKIYLNQHTPSLKRAHLIARGCAILVALVATCVVLRDKTDFLSLISLFYYANLIVSLVFAFMAGRKMLVFAIGLAFFALCDASVGLSTMAELYIKVSEGSVLYSIIHPGFNLAWVFYVPSQALIAISLATSKLNNAYRS